MKAPEAVYLPLGGGLGDALFTYLRGQLGWGFLKSLKETYPNTYVRVICSTHNPQTLELIKYNPYIDEAHDYGWQLNGADIWESHRGNAVRLQNQKALVQGLVWTKPRLYLSEDDLNVAKQIRAPLALIHPFAGMPERMGMPADEYIPLIDTLIDDYGLNVAVVGQAYDRKGVRRSHPHREYFEYERKGLLNLVNKSNIRVGLNLVQRAKIFIGCWSAFSCASWLYNKKTIIINPKKQVAKLNHKRTYRWKRAKIKQVPVRLLFCSPQIHTVNFNHIRNQILKKYKEYYPKG